MRKIIFFLVCFSHSNKESGYARSSRTAAYHLHNKCNDMFKNNEIKNSSITALHIDEINIQKMITHTNKACAFGISINSTKNG